MHFFTIISNLLYDELPILLAILISSRLTGQQVSGWSCSACCVNIKGHISLNCWFVTPRILDPLVPDFEDQILLAYKATLVVKSLRNPSSGVLPFLKNNHINAATQQHIQQIRIF